MPRYWRSHKRIQIYLQNFCIQALLNLPKNLNSHVLKQGNITPGFKKGYKECKNSCMSVSILSNVSNVFQPIFDQCFITVHRKTMVRKLDVWNEKFIDYVETHVAW